MHFAQEFFDRALQSFPVKIRSNVAKPVKIHQCSEISWMSFNFNNKLTLRWNKIHWKFEIFLTSVNKILIVGGLKDFIKMNEALPKVDRTRFKIPFFPPFKGTATKIQESLTQTLRVAVRGRTFLFTGVATPGTFGIKSRRLRGASRRTVSKSEGRVSHVTDSWLAFVTGYTRRSFTRPDLISRLASCKTRARSAWRRDSGRALTNLSEIWLWKCGRHVSEGSRKKGEKNNCDTFSRDSRSPSRWLYETYTSC